MRLNRLAAAMSLAVSLSAITAQAHAEGWKTNRARPADQRGRTARARRGALPRQPPVFDHEATGGHGITYSNARTPANSDSFPGLLALVTGGSPVTSGLFYDVSYERSYFANGDSTCSAS